jgi:hypothetical protein
MAIGHIATRGPVGNVDGLMKVSKVQAMAVKVENNTQRRGREDEKSFSTVGRR